ncbi:bacillithiol biosynthesis deacetylase BshB2 [Anaerobacillus alkaliphilus]|uniref:Bacillithiol biosynthesis deacetylase BshB2 n=1 Tax=Anaerobacillus alkaliphilus TaxID=1548597 RepID=A0A4Q0VZQ4_9BACI|nr:bacillithiol biosynthesis deacetylase BshB2 [Anaerobacillus alkaliphilus]RXJ04071.1 bacillithiol biosynthesis deacetylase BshB2 [Anaerobacillus alkaliphilus]
MKENHVLVVFPHPDDESFGPGGTIAEYTQSGIPVTYACLTLGEMGRNMGTPPFANRETLPLLRKEELADACAILGINDLRMLGYRDKTVEFEDEDKVIASIKEIINEIKPSLIITHYPGHGVHPDHDATGHATVEAVRQLPVAERPTVHCMAITKERERVLGKPDVVKDVSETMDTKIAAIKAHRSQTEAIFKQSSNQKVNLRNWLTEEQFWTYRF